MNELWAHDGVILELPRDGRAARQRLAVFAILAPVAALFGTFAWTALMGGAMPSAIAGLWLVFLLVGGALVAPLVGVRRRPTLRVEVRQTSITVGDRRFDIKVLFRARFRHNRIVLGFRDGNDWASEPVLVDDPERLVDILQAVMPTLEDFKQEGHAEHTVRRTLADLRSKQPVGP